MAEAGTGIDAGSTLATTLQHARLALTEQQRRGRTTDGQQDDVPRSQCRLDVQGALDVIFETLLLPPGTHPVAFKQSAAFEALASIIQLDSCLEALQTTPRSKQVAQVIFDHWFSTEPHVHCRSLLESIVSRSSLWSTVKRPLLEILQAHLAPGNKRCLQILSIIFDFITDEDLDGHFPDLLLMLLPSLRETSGALQAAKTLSKLAARRVNDQAFILESLPQELLPFMLDRSQNVRQVIYDTFLPPLIPKCPDLSHRLLHVLSEEAQSSEVLLSYLTLVRLVQNAELALPEGIWTLVETCLVHADAALRLEAYRLLIGSNQASPSRQSLSPDQLLLHKTFWQVAMGDSDSAATRTSLIGCWKDFIVRARSLAYAASRNAKKQQDTPAQESLGGPEAGVTILADQVERVQDFFEWWTALAAAQLTAVKPYRCSANALRYLEVLLGEGLDPDYVVVAQTTASKRKARPSWPFQIRLTAGEDFQRRLLSCVVSTYEDIKSSAANMLKSSRLTPRILQALRTEALQLLDGQRDAEISSSILMLRILKTCSVKEGVEETIFTTLRSRLDSMLAGILPISEIVYVHGHIAALNALLNEKPPQALENKITDILKSYAQIAQDVWSIVRPGLCLSGVEATADDPLEDEQDLEIRNASWRALKEAGELLTSLLTLPGLASQPYWDDVNVQAAATLIETWLLQVEHRGAFAYISNAYGRICAFIAASPARKIACLPRLWLQRHLDYVLLREQRTARRSAGIPYLILGAVSTSIRDSSRVDYAFNTLLAALAAESGLSVPARSHALNILRVLFQDAKLGQHVKPYIEGGFVAAVNGFGSHEWAVRNGSLLLYAALIQRVFGTNKEHLPLSRRPSLQSFFEQYPLLHRVLLQELAATVDSTADESLGSIFSALLLLSLLRSNTTDVRSGTALGQPFLPSIERASASPVWKVREAAAAALTGVVPVESTWVVCQTKLDNCRKQSSSNATHGWLLQALHLMRTSAEPPTASLDLSVVYEMLANSNVATPNRALCADILLWAISTGTTRPSIVHEAGLLHKNAHRDAVGYMSYEAVKIPLLLQTGQTEHDFVELAGKAYCETGWLAILSFLRNYPDTYSSSIVPFLLAVLRSWQKSLDAAILAAEVVLHLEEVDFRAIETQDLDALFRSITARSLREALMPVLARACTKAINTQQLFEATIRPAATDESVTCRMAACRALGYLNARVTSFDFGRTLVDLLQDEDLDVRQTAARVASKQYLDSKSVQPSSATITVWQQLVRSATAQDALVLFDSMLEDIRSVCHRIETGKDVLFAVEKTNVYIDPMVNLEYCGKILANFNTELQVKMLEQSPVISRASKLLVPESGPSKSVRPAVDHVRAELALRLESLGKCFPDLVHSSPDLAHIYANRLVLQ